MAVTVASFRSTFPEFTDTTLFPDASITFWKSVASQLVNPSRWKAMTDTGVMLLTAHYVVFAARDAASAEAGGIPGESQGVISGKTVDSLSYSVDTSVVAGAAKGDLALSSYGLRYSRLARLFGIGGLQL
jgi:hypothetical protein